MGEALKEDELLIFKKRFLDIILGTPGSDLDFYARILESNDTDEIEQIYDEFVEDIQKA